MCRQAIWLIKCCDRVRQSTACVLRTRLKLHIGPASGLYIGGRLPHLLNDVFHLITSSACALDAPTSWLLKFGAVFFSVSRTPFTYSITYTDLLWYTRITGLYWRGQPALKIFKLCTHREEDHSSHRTDKPTVSLFLSMSYIVH